MREIVYALRFRGRAHWLGPDGNVVAMVTTALSCTVRSRVGMDELTATRELGRGDAATCDAELILTGNAVFQQTATVAFGDLGDVLRLSTVGTGHLRPAPVGAARRRRDLAGRRRGWAVHRRNGDGRLDVRPERRG